MKTQSCFLQWVPEKDMPFHEIERRFGKTLHYASMGRFALYHILTTMKMAYGSSPVMMPVYACNSIEFAIRKAGLEPKFYDIDHRDMNGSLDSIQKIAHETGSRYLILPSLYGNPADLEGADKLCAELGIHLIDDSAQAFGATLNDRMVGTFGEAGLFSFSAGKPTFGHMGGFFWSDLPCTIQRTGHPLYHRAMYFDYFYNRYGDYRSDKLYRSKLFHYLTIAMYKLSDVSNDDICKFEKELLCRIAAGNMEKDMMHRRRIMDSAKECVRDKCRIISNVRGTANNNKIVALTENSDQAEELMVMLKDNNIHCARGYHLLDHDSKKYPVAESMCHRVVEIPMAADFQKNMRACECIKNFCDKK